MHQVAGLKLNLRPLEQAIDSWVTSAPDSRGYGDHDTQHPWRYDPAIEQSRPAFLAFLRVLVERGLRETYLQIGLGRHGGSHRAFTMIAARVVTVEVDAARAAACADHCVAEGRGELIVGDAGDPRVVAEATARANGCDVLFLDGGESYDAAARDWQSYAPLVRVGGIVAIADGSQANPEQRYRYDVDGFAFDLRRDYLAPRGIRLHRIGGARAIHYYVVESVDQALPRFRVPANVDGQRAVLVVEGRNGFDAYRHRDACLAVRSGVGFEPKWIARGEYDVVLAADDEAGIAAVIDAYAGAVPELQRARALLGADRPDEAMQVASDVLRAFPGLRQALQPCLEVYPHSRELLLAQATACAFGDRRQEAVYLLRQALQQDVTDREVLLTLAKIYVSLLDDEVGARALLAEVGARAKQLRIEAACRDHLSGKALWSYPTLLDGVRGVIQVGAGAGEDVAAFAAVELDQQALFEPRAEACAELRRRCAASAREDASIEVFETALAAEPGRRQLWSGADPAHASLYRQHPLYRQAHPEQAQGAATEVEVSTLDTLVASGALDPRRYNLLVVAVEGAELEVLRGARQMLRHVDVICVSFFNRQVYAGAPLPEEIQAFLREVDDDGFGLRAYEVGNDPLRGDALFKRTRIRRH